MVKAKLLEQKRILEEFIDTFDLKYCLTYDVVLKKSNVGIGYLNKLPVDSMIKTRNNERLLIRRMGRKGVMVDKRCLSELMGNGVMVDKRCLSELMGNGVAVVDKIQENLDRDKSIIIKFIGDYTSITVKLTTKDYICDTVGISDSYYYNIIRENS